MNDEQYMQRKRHSFWARVNIGSGEECWEWQGGKYHFGHGATTLRGRPAKAHRVAWELSRGPLPAGAYLLHKCDNPPCCNPAHLFVGTQADNMADMVKKKRHSHGEKRTLAKLTDERVRDMRFLAETLPVSRRALAAAFGVSPKCVTLVLARQAWKHVE